ncbi:hypothetical protein N657DRAFT_629449 [Parathielavia appendiculata]|uniref:Uncharacterized protein n=1 Tax=Parathielavia appendiculata TaxID=2587402 RepID=A0AAN6U8C2_9PEZI|nr:hypothetical protein N657DRAFT_629449 [Parathielavia appendiculata]
MKLKTGAGRIERQHQRVQVIGNRHDGAFLVIISGRNRKETLCAVVAATMLAFIPLCKPLTSLDGRLARYILVPNRQSAMGLRSSSSVESRLPRDREQPCSFRTRLVDPVTDPDADIVFESTDKLDSDDLKLDDSQCISVGRCMGKFKAIPELPIVPNLEHGQVNDTMIAKELGPCLHSIPTNMSSPGNDEKIESAESAPEKTVRLCLTIPQEHQDEHTVYGTLSDPTTACRKVWIQENDDNDDSNGANMEAMNMPFWNLPRRQKRHTYHVGDPIPDDMSIISNISLIPTYFPSDVMKQQRPHHRAVIKRLIRTKARAARQTMRELKRTCRDAVGNVFVEAAFYQPPKCVAVGSAS